MQIDEQAPSTAAATPPLPNRIKTALRRRKPSSRAWCGAILGALAVFIALLVSTANGLYGAKGPLWVALSSTFFVAAFALFGGLLTLLGLLLRRLPPLYGWICAAILGAMAFIALVGIGAALGIVAAIVGLVGAASLLGAGLATLTGPRQQLASGRSRGFAWGGTIVGGLLLLIGGVWLLDDGSEIDLEPYPTDVAVSPLDLANPSQPGAYAVRTLSYGSGTDRHRDLYGSGITWKTEPVDGTPFVDGWNRLRTAYWGFGPEALPRNGRVWLPEGDGPFPLVIMLHGQHTMVEDSDAGYGYLGELLASRGMIAVSVDENFLNLSPVHDLLFFSQLKDDGDLRGWLLLEHLKLWRTWATTPDHPLYGKVNLDTIALMGHSRGGEAVAIAGAFNRLPSYPDDGTVTFDYSFGIRSIIAIAPVDRTYEPAGQPISLQDVNYLLLHGAHDMDVLTVFGSSQYERTQLTPGSDTFKARFYIYGANHGQFNTIWGRKDFFEPIMRVYNLAQLMPGEDQRRVSKTAISAFLEATLLDKDGYRTLFRDPRTGAQWLPKITILSQYADSETTFISTYEEDVNLATTTLPEGRIDGAGLSAWRETRQTGKFETRDNQVAALAWTTDDGSTPARYSLSLPSTPPALSETGAALVLDIADAGEAPDPDGRPANRPAPEPMDLTLELIDNDGNIARLALSSVMPVLPQLEGQLGKAAFFSPVPSSEPVLQHLEFPLDAFEATNHAFDGSRLRQMCLVFDRTPAGSIVLDNIGIRLP